MFDMFIFKIVMSGNFVIPLTEHQINVDVHHRVQWVRHAQVHYSLVGFLVWGNDPYDHLQPALKLANPPKKVAIKSRTISIFSG